MPGFRWAPHRGSETSMTSVIWARPWAQASASSARHRSASSPPAFKTPVPVTSPSAPAAPAGTENPIGSRYPRGTAKDAAMSRRLAASPGSAALRYVAGSSNWSRSSRRLGWLGCNGEVDLSPRHSETGHSRQRHWSAVEHPRSHGKSRRPKSVEPTSGCDLDRGEGAREPLSGNGAPQAGPRPRALNPEA